MLNNWDDFEIRFHQKAWLLDSSKEIFSLCTLRREITKCISDYATLRKSGVSDETFRFISNPPTPKKCSLFSHLKCCLRQSFCLFRTLISKVDMGEKVKIFLHFLHVLSYAVICCEEEEEAELISLRGASKRPRLFLLRLFIIPHRGQINHRASSRYNSPSHFDSLLYLFFVLSVVLHICIALEGKQFKNQTN